MWPFFKREKGKQGGSRPAAQDHRPRPMKFAQLLDGMGDFSDLRHHDKALKFWLPEPAYEALEDLSGRNGVTMSEALRQFFAAHCYGIYAYQLMVDAIPDLFRESSQPMLSRAFQPQASYPKRNPTYWVPELGKNVEPVKVWVPARMASELQMLADHVGIKLSQYVREIVISRLLGHGTLPMRPEMLKAEPLPAVEEWSEGAEDMDMPMRQVSEEEYSKSEHGEIRWVDAEVIEDETA
jgi:predicted DNA-binding protein